MKKILLILIMAISPLLNAQELPKFEITKNGIEPIVISIENLNSSDIYSKTIKWIHYTFKNPKEVITSDIENELLIINAFEKNGHEYSSGLGLKYLGDVKYIITINFKEERYRLNIEIENLYDANGTPYKYKPKSFFKKSGELKKSKKIDIESLNNFFNRTSMSIHNYITGKQKKDDW